MPSTTWRRAVTAGVAAVTAIAALSGCGSTAGDAVSGETPTVVHVGIAPYFEYQPWVVAHELSLDAEQGIELQFTSYNSSDRAVVAAYRGDVDIAASCLACTLPLIAQVPTIQDFMITNQFKGFILIGRNGQTETFDELSAEVGDEEAKSRILKGLEGKQFAIRSSSYSALLSAALDQVGLTLDDIEIIDFASDSQAAIAYVGGTADYYIGSLPEEARLLASPDEYVNVGGTEVLGDAGLWFSSMAAEGDWLAGNPATVDRLLAVWYRTMLYLQEAPDVAVPLFAAAVNEATASDLSVETVGSIITDLERFATLDQAASEFYDPSSPLYYRLSVDFYEAQNADVLPDDYDQEASITAVPTFERLLENQDLVDWVSSPVE